MDRAVPAPTLWTVIDCPMCGYRKKVVAKPVSRRVCPRCRRYFKDPFSQPDTNGAEDRVRE